MKKIDKIINQIKNNKWIHLAIITVIGIILSIPLNKIQLRDTHDGFLHLLRLIGTNNALEIGEIPPIISPYFCNNWGYAINLFYNPLVTYLPLLIKLITPSYAVALKVFASLTIIFSGITMYICTYDITKNRAIALFSGILYLIVPYKLADVYKRFAVGEFTAFVFLPLLFMGIYSLFNGDKSKHYFIAIGATGLILTHTITTFYTAIFCLLYILFNLSKLKDTDIIKKVLINLLFIILLTIFFLMPMLEAKLSTDYTLFNTEIMGTNNKSVYSNTLEIKEFFKDKGEEDNATTYIIGIPTFILMCLTVFTYKKVDKKYKIFYIICLVFSILSLFMSTKYCPWFIFPNFLCLLQFPWRMMTFFTFFISFVTGVNMYIILKSLIKKDILRLILSVIVIILIIGYTIPIILQYKSDDINRDKNLEENIIQNPYISHMGINREYLSTKAYNLINTYLIEREDRIYILSGNSTIINEEKEGLTLTAKLKNSTEGAILEFPFLYYPGYKVFINYNEETKVYNAFETDNGFVGVKLLEDMDYANIEVKYVGTVVTYISYIISFISLIIFIIYIFSFSSIFFS